MHVCALLGYDPAQPSDSLKMAPLLSILTLAASPALRLAVDEGAPCEVARRLAPALRAEGLEVASAGWLLVARAEGRQLTVRLTDRDGALVGERLLNATEACDVFPHTVALLVKAWVTQRIAGATQLRLEPGTGAGPGVGPGLAPSRAGARREAPKESKSPPQTAAPQDPPPPALAPAAPAPPAVEAGTSPPPLEVTGTGRPSTSLGMSGAPLQRAPLQTEGARRSFAVEVMGGAAIAPADQLTAQGQLLADWGFLEPWGMMLDLGLQSTRSAHLGPGAVSLSLAFASLLARVRFSPLPHSHLLFGLGARLELLSARATGYSENSSVSLLAGGPVLTAQWRQRLTGGLFLAVLAEAHLRTRPETFSIERVGTVLTLPPLAFSAGLGAGWEFP